jgi:hypothetical protein
LNAEDLSLCNKTSFPVSRKLKWSIEKKEDNPTLEHILSTISIMEYSLKTDRISIKAAITMIIPSL